MMCSDCIVVDQMILGQGSSFFSIDLIRPTIPMHFLQLILRITQVRYNIFQHAHTEDSVYK